MKRILYQQSQFPIFQNRVYDTMKEAIFCPKGELEIVEDQSTGLVYNNAFQSDLVQYDGHYNNEQGISPFFQKHLEQVATLVEKTLGRINLVEVGCGKGFFLEMMLDRGTDITGFDPTYDGIKPYIIKDYFEPGLITHPANGLILRHVLEHIPEPIDFLFKLRDANGEGGLIYIEVPCFDWICNKRAWFDIFYEHVNYFRLSDFDRIFGKIITKGRFFGGQYLYIVADLSSLRIPMYDQFNLVSFPDDFLDSLDAKKWSKNKPTCIWGGASKGVIFSLLRERMGYPVDFVIDINPAKQRKFLPATGLLVNSPEVALKKLPEKSDIYVMNPNYLEEIKQMSGNIFNYVGVS